MQVRESTHQPDVCEASCSDPGPHGTRLIWFWKALLKMRSTQNGRLGRPPPAPAPPKGAHRNWTSGTRLKPGLIPPESKLLVERELNRRLIPADWPPCFWTKFWSPTGISELRLSLLSLQVRFPNNLINRFALSG